MHLPIAPAQVGATAGPRPLFLSELWKCCGLVVLNFEQWSMNDELLNQLCVSNASMGVSVLSPPPPPHSNKRRNNTYRRNGLLHNCRSFMSK